jgi:hypothetical protein
LSRRRFRDSEVGAAAAAAAASIFAAAFRPA